MCLFLFLNPIFFINKKTRSIDFKLVGPPIIENEKSSHLGRLNKRSSSLFLSIVANNRGRGAVVLPCSAPARDGPTGQFYAISQVYILTVAFPHHICFLILFYFLFLFPYLVYV